VSFAAITLCVASQRVFIVVVSNFVIDSVRKLLGVSSYIKLHRTRREAFKTSCVRQTVVTLTDRSLLILRNLSSYTSYVMHTMRWSLPQFSRFYPRIDFQ
jgi:hypothetical protein